MFQTDELRQKRNEMSIKIGSEKKAGNDASGLLQKMGEISKKLDDLEFLRGSMEKSLEIVNTITEKAVQKVLDQGVGVTNLDKPKKQYITQTDLYSKNSLTSTLEDRKTEF